MPLWFAAVLGLIQGVTEFIPVSSTAHLRVVSALLGRRDPGAEVAAMLQLGTLIAVVAYFARDLAACGAALVTAPSSPPAHLAVLLAAATLPIVVVGVALRRRIETDLRSLYVVAGALIVIGVAMAIIDHHAGPGGRPLATLSLADAMLVGFAQALAVVPGVSRSGATITMALLLGLSRGDAARLSFLLSIPAVAGAGVLEARGALRKLGGGGVAAITVGVGVAAITGYATIAWLLHWLATHRLAAFAAYRIVAGVALAGALAAGFVSAI